jgi:hypothetical protein
VNRSKPIGSSPNLAITRLALAPVGPTAMTLCKFTHNRSGHPIAIAHDMPAPASHGVTPLLIAHLACTQTNL